MAPTLPTELLAEILALENADQSPIQRQLNRQRFELVCKSWFSSVDRWSELAIQGTAGLRNARRVFEADDEYSDEAGVVGPRVRSICFSIEAGAQTRVGRVVRRVVNLSRFEMSGYYRDDVRSLGKNLPDQLSGLTRLQHFNLKRVDLSIEDLTKFVPEWPELESFVLERCRIILASDPTGTTPLELPFDALFALQTHLRSLVLHVAVSPGLLTAIIQHLPSTLTVLVLDCGHSDYRLRVSPVPSQVRALAGQLTEVALIGPWTLPDSLDLGRLIKVHTLGLSVCTDRGLPTSLATLAGLTEVWFVKEFSGYVWPNSMPQVAARVQSYMAEVTTLERVRVSSEAWEKCPQPAQQDVRAAAARHSVELVIA